MKSSRENDRDRLHHKTEGKKKNAVLDWIYRQLRKGQSPGGRVAFMTVAVVIVFFTTYGLILPAITMEKKVARDMPGIHLASDSGHDEERRTSGDSKTEDKNKSETDTGLSDDKKEKSDEESSRTDQDKTKKTKEEVSTGEENQKDGKDKQENVEESAEGEESAVSYAESPLTCKTVKYNVSLSFDEDAHIPEGTRLIVNRIRKNTPEYKSYDEALKKENKDIRSEIYFQITLKSGDQEIQPDKPVDIVFEKRSEDHREVKYGAIFRDGNKELKAKLIPVSGVSKESSEKGSKSAEERSGSAEDATTLTQINHQIVFSAFPLNEEKILPVVGLLYQDDRSQEEISAGTKGLVSENPEQSFQAQTDHLDIKVDAPKGALPDRAAWWRLRHLRTRSLLMQKISPFMPW